ncbi:FAD synthetase family protein [Pseudogracilibacillus sp. SE30717A]|uniref:FAD synthetase family protein n=1 Tax=Pseudogracilibacillus sp. SE30717A TaxID=3098293 RepID=UPI00300E05FD
MKIHRSEELRLDGAVIAIGAFDGIHKGHQKVIKRTVEKSISLNVPSVIYTFDIPPRAYFTGAKILSNENEKMKKLRTLGIDHTVIATFNEEYLNKTAESFIEKLAKMKPLHIIVGEDFRFGHKRTGDIRLLKHYFNVETISPVCCVNGERISSTRIRELILEGNIDKAIPLLT